jgi:hypothetical protein
MEPSLPLQLLSVHVPICIDRAEIDIDVVADLARSDTIGRGE